MPLSDLGMTGLTVVMAALVIGVAARRSTRLAVGVMAALVAWLGFAATVAASGALADWTARPPRLPFLPLAFFATMLVLSRTTTMRALVATTPRAWPIAAQTFRVGVELVLYALFVAGRAPAQITFEGRNLDILVGLTAPVVAWLVGRWKVPALALGWNVVGLAVLGNTIVTVLTSLPGPLHLDWPGPPFTAVASWPMIWLPAFLAPLALLLHVVSIQQTLPLLRRTSARPAPAG